MICADTYSKSECCNPDKVAGQTHSVGAQTWYDYRTGEATKKTGDLSACVLCVCDGSLHTPKDIRDFARFPCSYRGIMVVSRQRNLSGDV